MRKGPGTRFARLKTAPKINSRDVCQFAHSEEECKIWNYMKENNGKIVAINCSFVCKQVF